MEKRIDGDLRSVTVVLGREHRAWLIQKAAQRSSEHGGRLSESAVLRDLIDQARGGKAAAA